MSSARGPIDPANLESESDENNTAPPRTIETQLFESLIHHLIEKGVLTKNDALSIVQAVAEVKRGEQEEGQYSSAVIAREIATIEELYSSFELLRGGPSVLEPAGDGNIVRLRPPLHWDEPQFPRDG